MSLWVHLTPTPAVRFLIRLYVDPPFLKAELQAWGMWAPLVFIGIQALQVVVAPIPGEITGFLGGFVFGQWVGLAYSMVGLSLGSFLPLRSGAGSGSRSCSAS